MQDGIIVFLIFLSFLNKMDALIYQLITEPDNKGSESRFDYDSFTLRQLKNIELYCLEMSRKGSQDLNL